MHRFVRTIWWTWLKILTERRAQIYWQTHLCIKWRLWIVWAQKCLWKEVGRQHLCYASCFMLQMLGSLVELDLSHNLLEGRIPSEVNGLQKLRCFNISQNKISQLPEGVSALSQLTELRAGFNRLREVPEEVAQLSQLQILDFKDNHITLLPKALSRYWPALQRVFTGLLSWLCSAAVLGLICLGDQEILVSAAGSCPRKEIWKYFIYWQKEGCWSRGFPVEGLWFQQSWNYIVHLGWHLSSLHSLSHTLAQAESKSCSVQVTAFLHGCEE